MTPTQPDARKGLMDIARRIVAWQQRVDDLEDDLEYLNTGGGWADLVRISKDAQAILARALAAPMTEGEG